MDFYLNLGPKGAIGFAGNCSYPAELGLVLLSILDPKLPHLNAQYFSDALMEQDCLGRMFWL